MEEIDEKLKGIRLLGTDSGKQDRGVQPGPPEPPPSHLAVFILKDMQTERKALIPVPNSYQEAQQAAFQLFKPYLSQGNQASKISLRPSLTGKMEDCAEIEAKYWKLAFPLCKTVGVFQDVFLNGMLWITLWEGSGWTRIKPNDDKGERLQTPMPRPTTYQEAWKLLEIAVEKTPSWKGMLIDAAEERGDLTNWEDPYDIPVDISVTCYVFSGPTSSRFATRAPGSTEDFDITATDSWSQIPRSAHTDGEQWRRHLPLPGQILGFKLISEYSQPYM
ncbi:hypothetical protein FA15DRAFT_456021 [Coprinopsis marcescibilis]|uniref:Uncharacterized protein n=1 Tax=Coprinopsis marcescibilis TaxID=230819 RepID=A0A5C3L852_COPMA|nr:hypothetical protein FA15DRAFT_456021 [Coprinopsis marcescibilis]